MTADHDAPYYRGRVVVAEGSAWAPVTLPVFKTGGRPQRAMVCSTHTHFRHPLRKCIALEGPPMQVDELRGSPGRADFVVGRIALIGDISVTLICSIYAIHREKITDPTKFQQDNSTFQQD